MKLIRFKESGKIKPGIIDKDNNIRDFSKVFSDWNSEMLTESLLLKIREYKIDSVPIAKEIEKIEPCVNNVGKIICVGLNYHDHCNELGMKPPSEPIIFMKATSAITGANDEIHLPKNSNKTDWEAELGVVIGKKIKNINLDDAKDCIFGYCVVNDVSERSFQLEKGGQWTKGKSCDTFAPIGPYLVTKDEIKNPQNLNIWLEHNNKIVQNSSTNQMIFPILYLVTYLSQFMSLQPGDIISTGTPPGVGAGMDPQVFLKSGDKLKLGIEGLGQQSHLII